MTWEVNLHVSSIDIPLECTHGLDTCKGGRAFSKPVLNHSVNFSDVSGSM